MRWLIACVLAVSSSIAIAEGPVYAEVGLAASGVQHSDLDFYPIFGSASIGAFVLPGVGIELFADTVLDADSSGGFNLEVESAYGIATRFQSPPVNGVHGYITVGVVNFTVNQEADATPVLAGTYISEDFTGARLSVGVMQRMQHFRNLLVSFEYRHYNAGDPLRVDALVLGLRVNTP